MDRDQALATAERHLGHLGEEVGEELAIDRQATRPVPEGGWLVHWNTAAYIERGSVSDALAGNGPLLVDGDGNVRRLEPQD